MVPKINRPLTPASKNVQDFFSMPISQIWGVFGFLSPSNDYTAILDWLEKQKPEVGLLFIGENKINLNLILNPHQSHLHARISFTGWVSRENLNHYLQQLDGFLLAGKNKNNSYSLKVVLALMLL